MSADFVVLGPDAKAAINNVEFAVVEGRYRVTADEAETSDSESAPYKRVKVGLGQLEVDLTVQLATDVSLFAAPLNLAPVYDSSIGFLGVDLQLWPKGKTFDPYHCPHFKILTAEGDFKVKGSEVQTVKFSGKSDGTFTLPTN